MTRLLKKSLSATDSTVSWTICRGDP